MGIIEAAYTAFCKERFPVPSEAQVADLERQMRVALPLGYRRFLLDYNGGFFNEPHIVPAVEGCPEDSLDFLSGIGASPRCAELRWPPALSAFDDNDPPQILPIGYTVMGNLIFLVTHPEDNGCIALKKAGVSDSFYLAEGIEGFFKLLRKAESP
jgi:hypothetical protein